MHVVIDSCQINTHLVGALCVAKLVVKVTFKQRLEMLFSRVLYSAATCNSHAAYNIRHYYTLVRSKDTRMLLVPASKAALSC